MDRDSARCKERSRDFDGSHTFGSRIRKFSSILLVTATINATYAPLIQMYTIDWNLMKNTQERMKVFQREFREAQLSQNTYLLRKPENNEECDGRPNEEIQTAV